MLYKFVTRHWMDAFFATGSLRLGTLHGYRADARRHDAAVGAAPEPDYDDAYVFCSAGTFNPPAFRQWLDWPESYDACYEISSPAFFDAISAVVRRSAIYGGFNGRVEAFAAGRRRTPEAPEASQRRRVERARAGEVRAVWNPRLPGSPLTPLSLDVPTARQFARPFAVWEGNTIRFA